MKVHQKVLHLIIKLKQSGVLSIIVKTPYLVNLFHECMSHMGYQVAAKLVKTVSCVLSGVMAGKREFVA